MNFLMGLLLGIIVCGYLVWKLITSGIDFWMGFRSKAWPHTVGQVSSAEVKKKNRGYWDGEEKITYRAKVIYKYRVSGAWYMGTKIAFGYEGGRGGVELWKASERAENYRDSNQITVYYNPNDPSKSVLEPGTEYALSPIELVGLLIFNGIVIFHLLLV